MHAAACTGRAARLWGRRRLRRSWTAVCRRSQCEQQLRPELATARGKSNEWTRKSERQPTYPLLTELGHFAPVMLRHPHQTLLSAVVQGLSNGEAPQYGAIVFNDNITQHIASEVGGRLYICQASCTIHQMSVWHRTLLLMLALGAVQVSDQMTGVFPGIADLNSSAELPAFGNQTASAIWQQLSGAGALAWGLLRATPEGRWRLCDPGSRPALYHQWRRRHRTPARHPAPGV